VSGGGTGAGGDAHLLDLSRGDDEEYIYEFVSPENLQKIICPITGVPMRYPVVAADGHTYER
jgi:hypothetical protein